MIRKLMLTLLLSFSILFSGCNQNNNVVEEPEKELGAIKQVVQQYYINLEKGKYIEALNYINYGNDNTKVSDESWLNQNKTQYSIGYSKYGNIVGYEYSPKAKQYRAVTLITIDNKIDEIDKAINESVYLKKIDGNFTIVHIASEDVQLKNRSGLYSSNWTVTYDEEYRAIQ